jgi:hypothetical protein
MKNLSGKIFTALATGLISCALYSEQAQAAAPISTCVDFSTLPDNTVLGPSLQAGLHFTQLGMPTMFANETAGRVGLQFPDAGLEIALPRTRKVKMVIGTFGGVVKLEVRDGANVISSQAIDTSNAYITLIVSKPIPFTKLVFRGGQNEAILVRICAYLDCN